MFSSIVPLEYDEATSTTDWAADFRHSQTTQMVELSLDEVAAAAAALPIAVVKDTAETLRVMAVLGLEKNDNLLVDEKGHWHANFVPAAVRLYPFALVPTEPSGEAVLGYDVGSQLIGPGGEHTLAEAGQPTPLARDIEATLRTLEKGRQAAQSAAQALQIAGLLESWKPELEQNGQCYAPENLLGINLPALSQQPGAMLEALNQVGALALAYAQDVSKNNFQTLGRRLRHAELNAKPLLFDA